jgi:predicted transcriptional regulator
MAGVVFVSRRVELETIPKALKDKIPSPQLHDNSVHWFRMKNITLSADEDLIERARSIARGQRRTLNEAFREWLAQFAQSAGDAQGFDALMRHLQHVDAGRHFGRDELNER